jgi:hypothetical protein
VYISIAAVAISVAQEIPEGNIDIDALFGESAEITDSADPVPSAQTPPATSPSGGAKTAVQNMDEIPEGNIDIDALFGGDDTAVTAKPADPTPVAQPAPNPAAVSVKKKGIRLSSNYSFSMGTSPGWYETPWNKDSFEKSQDVPDNFTNVPGVIMAASFGFDTQISDIFSVRASFAYEFPTFAIGVSAFYFDYAAANKVFIRAGKWTSKWGISSNYPFTDLLSRTPKSADYAHPEDKDPETGYEYKYTGGRTADPYMARVDIPIGIGGFQLLTMTHDDFFVASNSKHQDDLIGIGGKYNLAFRWADITLGTFYQKIMPLRTFLSVKSTIKNTEIYSELLNTVEHETWDKPTLSVNLGLGRSFFSKKLTIGGEFFYNGEDDAFWVREADAKLGQVTKDSPFIEGVNFALNVSYKPGWHSLNFFARGLYSIAENTGKFIPGFSISPGQHVTARFAVPMVLGSRDGTYYRNNDDTNNRPFSLVFAVSVGGSYSYGHYE